MCTLYTFIILHLNYNRFMIWYVKYYKLKMIIIILYLPNNFNVVRNLRATFKHR